MARNLLSLSLSRKMKRHWRLLLASMLAVGSAFTLVVNAVDSDNNGMSDEYEWFFGLDPATDAATADPDADNLSNLQESHLWTDPFAADTDRSGFPDSIADNPLSRAFIPWGEPLFTHPDGTVLYTWPLWMQMAWADGGQWLTNIPYGWHSPAAETNAAALYMEIDRAGIDSNLVLNVAFFDHTNSSLYLDLFDSNDTVTASALYGNLLPGTGTETNRILEIPFAANPAVTGLRLRKGVGDVTIYSSLLYVDADLDGLDAEQELQLGTSDQNADTDGDGISDYDEVFVDGTDPLGLGGPVSKDSIVGQAESTPPVGYYPNVSVGTVGTGGSAGSRIDRNVVLGYRLPILPAGSTVTGAVFRFEINGGRDSGNLTPSLNVYLLNTSNPDSSGTSFFYHGASNMTFSARYIGRKYIAIGTSQVSFPDDQYDVELTLTGDALTLLKSFYGGDNVPDQPEAFFRFNLDKAPAVSTYIRYSIDLADDESSLAVFGGRSVAENQPPVVNAGANQTVYLAETVTPGLWFGTVPGNINTTTPNPKYLLLTNVASRTEDAIPANTTEVFTGFIFDADGKIAFTENIDDKARIWIDGVLVLANDSYKTRTSTANLNLSPGWHAIEIRISNGSGGSGPYSGMGIGYDPNGGTSWRKLSDPGDGSFLRVVSPVQAVANLVGTTTDPEGDLLATGWSVVSPTNAAVTFGKATMTSTTATFTKMGVYTLRLTADDSQTKAFDDVQIIVVAGFDSDGDGVPDSTELLMGTDPLSANEFSATQLAGFLQLPAIQITVDAPDFVRHYLGPELVEGVAITNNPGANNPTGVVTSNGLVPVASAATYYAPFNGGNSGAFSGGSSLEYRSYTRLSLISPEPVSEEGSRLQVVMDHYDADLGVTLDDAPIKVTFLGGKVLGFSDWHDNYRDLSQEVTAPVYTNTVTNGVINWSCHFDYDPRTASFSDGGWGYRYLNFEPLLPQIVISPTNIVMCTNATMQVTASFEPASLTPSDSTPIWWTLTGANSNSVVIQESCSAFHEGGTTITLQSGTLGGGPYTLTASPYGICSITATAEVNVVKVDIVVDLEDQKVNGVRSGLKQDTLKFDINGNVIPISNLTLQPTTVTVDGEQILTKLKVTYVPSCSELNLPGSNTVKVDIDDMVDNHMDQVLNTFQLP